MTERSTRRRWWRYALLLLALTATIGVREWLARQRTQAPVVVQPKAQQPVWRPDLPARRHKRPPPAFAAPACAPHASERCQRGDVWSFDGCGRIEQKVEECGPRLCEDDACLLPGGSECTAPPEGRCNGTVVELCMLGRTMRIDCGAQGLRCAQGAEGAACAPIVPIEERCSGPARCEGDVLTRCVDGKFERTDCLGARASCVPLPDGAGPACVTLAPSGPIGCGQCGCPPDASRSEQLCDAIDEDGDGRLDEELDCGPVSLLAIRVTDERGEAEHSIDDVRAELEDLNRIFAATDLPGALQFAPEVIDLPAPWLRDLDEDELRRLADDALLHPPREGFYVPVVFADRVLATGGVPKPGMSTLPNGTCGGIQQSHGPEVGLIAVAKARYPTTLAHEVGHFFGLCHTHDQQRVMAFAAFEDTRTNGMQTCKPPCSGDGDGICDTPLDPGPEQCRSDDVCKVACSDGAQPDAFNLMSYYADCREAFTPEQMALMQHTLALRRAWQRCVGGRCPCQPNTEECPVGMSCRPAHAEGQTVARCALDGSRRVGAVCRGADDCVRGALCVMNQGAVVARCARMCTGTTPDCTCMPVDDGLQVCLQDL